MSFKPTTRDLMSLYDKLAAAHGPSGWWPAEVGGDFEIICGAILTQNTAWRNAERALRQMRADDIWSFDAVNRASDEKLQAAVRSAGYYRTKAKKLKLFAEFMLAEFGGSAEGFAALSTAELRTKLLGVWGIGPETADDIVLYVADRPSFVIDKYTQRLAARLGWRVTPPTYDGHKALFERLLPADAELMQEYHGLIDLHCARVCKAKPECEKCVLQDTCAYPRKRNVGTSEKRGKTDFSNANFDA